MRKVKTLDVLTAFCITAVSAGYFSCRHFLWTRSSHMAESMREGRVFSNVQRMLDSIAFVVSNHQFEAWDEVFDDCSASLGTRGERDAQNPFPATDTERCRFGRTRRLPSGCQASKTPLIWHLAEFPPGFDMLDEYDPIGGKYDRKEGKTVVVFWNGELRYMPLSDVEKSLSALLKDRPDVSLFVLDRWQENGEPLWRELKWDRPK